MAVAGYAYRVVDDELDELLPSLPAISLEGPKGVGKTATAQRRAASVFALDDPAQRELMAADPGRLDRRPWPVLVDEWQRAPSVWDLVRRSVDRDPTPGRFLLTGSAAPLTAPTHSGAGRIVQVRMRPMSLAERGLTLPSVSLAALLTGDRLDIEGSNDLTLPDYAEEILRSGFPGIRQLSGRARRAQLDGYLARVVERDFPDQGHQVRRPATLHAWLSAYAAATASTASYNALLDAATPGESDKPAKTTTIAYRDVLSALWLLDPVPGWSPTRSPFTRLGSAPKHHLADPALAARLLRADAGTLLDDTVPGTLSPRQGPLLGALFESLVTLSVRVYAQAAEAGVHHLRTRDGDHEIDLIVQRDDQRVLALEVKLAPTVDDRDTTHLKWLRSRLGEDLLDAAVITTGAHVYRRADGIAVIPAAALGP
jgi:predicted AAA+ superfamily ATPase